MRAQDLATRTRPAEPSVHEPFGPASRTVTQESQPSYQPSIDTALRRDSRHLSPDALERSRSLQHIWTADQLPKSDPLETKRLWAAVSAASLEGKPPSKRRKHGIAINTEEELSGTVTEPESASDALQAETITTRTASITIKSKDFVQCVLTPRRINFSLARHRTPTPFAHFGTSKTDYQQLPGLETARVWVQLNDRDLEEVAQEYEAMNKEQLNEEEFAIYATEKLLLGELRSKKSTQEREWRSERMLQFTCKPTEGRLWSIPPVFGRELSTYSWDVRADCSYWLQMRGFNRNYGHHIKEVVFVHPRSKTTCPYFTVEFKRANENEEEAIRQTLTASSIALYNRYRLYLEATESGLQSHSHVTDIRHYALTMVQSTFTVWVVHAEVGDNKWNGCMMSRLCEGDCMCAREIRELVDWINEIHRWGLTNHALSCEKDAKCVLRSENFETSELE